MNKLILILTAWMVAVLAASCQAQPRHGEQSGPSLFTTGSPISIGSNPNDLAVGDWNKDGKLDVVTCNEGDTVAIWLGNGRGGFAPAAGSPMRMAAHIVVAGDVNHDRNLDLALTHHDSFGVIVLLGAGDGKFSAAPGSPFVAHQGTKAHNHGLTLTDVNSDGNPDLITSNQDDNSVSVLLGDGRGGFAPAAGSPFAVGSSPYPHAVGDVNGDSRPDIVTPNVRSNDVSVLLGDGKGGFAPAANSPYRVETRPYYIAIGDVSGDGKPDLITTHDDINLMTTLLGDGRGGFALAPGSPFDVGRRAYKIVAADLDKDGRVELIMGTEGSDSVTVLSGSERGGYKSPAGSPYRAGANPRVAIGDVNNDGKPDIITANNGSGDLTVLLGNTK